MNFLLVILALSPLSFATVCSSSNLNGLAVGQKFPFTQSGTKTYGTYTINSLSGYFSVVDGCTLGVSITLGSGDSITSPMGIQVYGKTTTGTSGFPVGSTVISGSGTININIPFDTTTFVVNSLLPGVSWIDVVSLTLFSPSTIAGSGWQVTNFVAVTGTSNTVPAPVIPAPVVPAPVIPAPVIPAPVVPAPAAPVVPAPAASTSPAGTKAVSGALTPSPTTSNALVSSISMITIITLLFLIFA